MKFALFSPRALLALVALSVAVPATVGAQTGAAELARRRAAPSTPSTGIAVGPTIRDTSPHPCSIDKLQVTSTMLVAICKPHNKHGGDTVTRFAYPLHHRGAQLMLELLLAARAEKKQASIEFQKDTTKNLDGCPKQNCRNILSVTW